MKSGLLFHSLRVMDGCLNRCEPEVKRSFKTASPVSVEQLQTCSVSKLYPHADPAMKTWDTGPDLWFWPGKVWLLILGSGSTTRHDSWIHSWVKGLQGPAYDFGVSPPPFQTLGFNHKPWPYRHIVLVCMVRAYVPLPKSCCKFGVFSHVEFPLTKISDSNLSHEPTGVAFCVWCLFPDGNPHLRQAFCVALQKSTSGSGPCRLTRLM